MNQDGLIDPNQPAPPPEAFDPKKVVKKKSDIIERKEPLRVFTEDGKELLD